MRSLLLLASLFGAPGVRAQSTIVGDAWIAGQVMVGTTTASGARLNVAASSATTVPFQVSGVDLTPFLRVGADGKVGLSTYSTANLDVMGSGDDGSVGLELHSGNLYGASAGRAQIAFGKDGTTNYRHHIDSVHVDSTAHNSIDFLVWSQDAGSATSLATMTVVSLVTVASTVTASVHVRPVDDPNKVMAELIVSNGVIIGGGTIHAAQQVTPSSREWKSDIAYLTPADEAAAYDRVRGLKHASFRYARVRGKDYVRDRRAPLRRGLIYEDAPAVLQGPGSSILNDQRLVEDEMAFKELARRLDALEKEVGP